MNIENNILRHYLKNAYFITGTAYAGKSTTAKMLAERYGMVLCGENYDSGCFRAAALIDGSDWSDEIHDSCPDLIKTSWNNAIDFVMNSSDDDFKANIETYFDLQSLLDYHITECICAESINMARTRFI